jgi:hypothetical protein
LSRELNLFRILLILAPLILVEVVKPAVLSLVDKLDVALLLTLAAALIKLTAAPMDYNALAAELALALTVTVSTVLLLDNAKTLLKSNSKCLTFVQ